MTAIEVGTIRRVGLIGLGAVAMPVARALLAGDIAGWALCSVLVRDAAAARSAMDAPPAHAQSFSAGDSGVHEAGGDDSVPSPGDDAFLANASTVQRWLAITDDADRFFAEPFDLVIDAAGPRAFAAHAERALACADLWTISAAALVDDALLDRLRGTAQRHGHRLRVLHGAIGGLDGVGAAAVDPASTLALRVELPPNGDAAALVFAGSVRDAARRFPDHVNVAAAAALAGPSLDHASIEIHRAPPGRMQRLSLTTESVYGRLDATTEPRVGPGIHPVAASIIAALRRESAWLQIA